MMKLKWFKRKGLFFIPIHFVGWIVLTACLGYAVYVFNDIDSRSHSASDTLINFVFNLTIIGAIYTLIAYFSSNNENGEKV